MRLPRTRRNLFAVGTAVTALAAGALWYGRTYPPALTGTYVGQAMNTPDTEIDLTLRPGGSGYLKLYQNPEESITWKADGDRIRIYGDSPRIAKRIDNDDVALDLGIMVRLHREE